MAEPAVAVGTMSAADEDGVRTWASLRITGDDGVEVVAVLEPAEARSIGQLLIATADGLDA